MDRLLKVAAAFVCAAGLTALASTPTATLTDTDGTAWANCSYTATLTILGATSTPAPTVGGVPVSPLVVTGSCSASGVISPTLTDTSTVDQKNAQWVFTIQSNTSAGSVKVSTPVVGSAPDLTKTFSILPAPRFATGASAYGYNDAEIQGIPLVGQTYYNVTTPCLRQYSLAGWTCGGGGSTSDVLPVPGAIADYLFLDGSGTSLTDSSGNGNNGTLGTSTAAPTWTINGLSFSGNQIVNLPAAINPGQTFAMGVCINPIPVNITNMPTNLYPPLITSTITGAQGLSILYSQSLGTTTGAVTATYGPTILAKGGHTTQAQVSFSGCHSYIVTLGTSGTSLDHVYIDGVELGAYAKQGASAGAQTSGNLIIGASSSSDVFNTSAFNGSMYRLVVYPTPIASSSIPALSGAIISDMAKRGANLTPSPVPQGGPILFAIGDSITNGTAGGGVTPWENFLTLTNQPTYSVVNAGIGGIYMRAIAGSEPNRIAPKCLSTTGPNVAIVFAGTNDYAGLTAGLPADPVLVFGGMTSEIKTLKSAGCTVFAATMLSRSGNGGSGVSLDADKNSYDALILTQAKAAGADGIVDFAAWPTIGADGAAAGAGFQSDHIHPTQTSQNQMGVIASNSLNYYFGSTVANPTVVTSTTYQMLSGDRAVTAAPTANAAYTLPDCTGPSGETYTISNPQSAFTLSIVGGASQPINGLATAITIPSNSTVTLRDVANPKSVSGCHWAM